jgi:hypothetical protein
MPLEGEKALEAAFCALERPMLVQTSQKAVGGSGTTSRARDSGSGSRAAANKGLTADLEVRWARVPHLLYSTTLCSNLAGNAC